MEKDKNQVTKIARECARDYSLLKNSGVDQTAIPPRQWIRAWMQTHYNIIKLSGYFYRELAKALDAKSSHANQDINEDMSLGLSKKVDKKYSRKTSDDVVNELSVVDNIDEMFEWFKKFFKYYDETVEKEEKIENDTNIYWRITFRKIWKNKKDKLGEIFFYREYKNACGVTTNILGLFSYDKDFDLFMKAHHPELFLRQAKQNYSLPVYGGANGDPLLVPVGTIKILADYYNEKAEIVLGKALDVKSSSRSNAVNEDMSLGLSKKVDKKFSKKTIVDVINEIALVDNIDDMLVWFKRLFKYYDKTVLKVEKVENKPINIYWKIEFKKILKKENIEDRLWDIYFYREYINERRDSTNVLCLLTYDDDFDLFMSTHHPELILNYADESSRPLYGNANGADPLLMPIGTIKILADYYNKKVERLLGVSESMSLGLGNRVKKIYSDKNSVENLGDHTCKILFERIKKIFENNGFTDDTHHKIIESSMTSVPTGYFKYTVNEYEDSIMHKGKEMFYSFYQVFVYIDNELELKYFDDTHFILEIRINPDIEDNNKETSKRVMIGTDLYDDVGWLGVRIDNRLIGQNLKNSVSVKDAMIDISSPEKVKAILADIEGIAKTLAAYQEDRKSGKLKLTDVYHEQSYIESYSSAVWRYLKKYFWKNSIAVNGTLQEGLSNKVKNKFDKVDAVDNVSPIQFEDHEVENICHEHDVFFNDDAAKVTSIKGWFKENNNIKSFNELKLFTGLKTIEEQDFSYCIDLQSVIIPRSVTSIEEYAFAKCESLHSVTIPSSVTSIGYASFYNCTSLQSVTIPDSVSRIRDYAFTLCKSLKSVVIPRSVTSIGEGAFSICKSLLSVTIPDNVTNIGERAFAQCESLQSVVIPRSVTIIGNNTFLGCASLKTIVISKNCPVYNQIRKIYPDIHLTEPKVNESSSLGLNKQIQKKFQDIDGIENLEFDYVDLGLPSGTLWCKHNYRATSEEESGERYAFDEAQKLDVIVPSKKDFIELYDNCVNIVDYVNGVYGIRFISKKNEKSIFLPVGSSKDGEKYWSSTEFSFASAHNLSINYNLIDPINYNSKFFKYPVRPVRKDIKESSLGLNSKVKKKFEGDNEGDKALEQVRPVFDCVDDQGKPVEVHMSDVDWKNKVFKWLYDNVTTLKIKEDDEYRAKRGHTTVKVDDFITNKYGGQISICLYHHEYSSYGPPSYIVMLADYFNGNPNFPLILTAHDLGNYSFCAVKLWKLGTKWRLSSEAYYQDKLYKSPRCPNGAWKRAKKTVTSKDCPILLKIK